MQVQHPISKIVRVSQNVKSAAFLFTMLENIRFVLAESAIKGFLNREADLISESFKAGQDSFWTDTLFVFKLIDHA